MRSSLNLQGDKTRIHQRRKLTKRLYFIDNNLKTKLPLVATMFLNSKKKKKNLEQLETLRRLQKHIKP